jgi:hypothetical protein
MTGSASSISARVVAAYRSSREAGADEWTACEKALEVFRRTHPDASADFANTFVSEALREAYPPDRIARPTGAEPVPVSAALRRAGHPTGAVARPPS